MLWVGIDEAGYGPNLGPLVMTAVVAKGPDDRPMNVWTDLASTVCRAREPGARLWVDDSKQVYKARKGRDRLDAACLAVVEASGQGRPSTFGALLEAVGAGTLDHVELSPWIETDPQIKPFHSSSVNPLCGAHWQIVEAKSVVVGPSRFNAELETTGSKALVHFGAFAGLLRHLWEQTTETVSASVQSDKHGGRHFYWDALVETFPDAWVDRGPEGPDLSRYSIREGERRLDLSLQPRADAENGLVALASLVSKAIREWWMDAFNAYWTTLLPGLKPTAGYPVDALRFRLAIEPECQGRGLDPTIWWRRK